MADVQVVDIRSADIAVKIPRLVVGYGIGGIVEFVGRMLFGVAGLVHLGGRWVMPVHRISSI